ncbi:hypothetical protein CAPTEDRAFT_212436 [Capitella teleta]|uniref:Uncharacterized protein n=1 Tax=Capitella teleta TaxID=283909 RepID=R7T9J1_CAPTE|nr:hypothetical protein CAPTEDRAFT_212436 [Capitella teleta]|eukprot:ELT88075.1 hypothetical protein CAPTEDRAFT_212436 [Capitella teleta]
MAPYITPIMLPIHLTRGFSSSLWTGIVTSSQIVSLTLLLFSNTREKRAVARSKNRRQKSAQTQLPDKTLLEYARESQAVEKKVLEEGRKELEEKMKIEEERKRLAVEKVEVEKMRNEMDQKTKVRGRNFEEESDREEEMTFPDGGIQVLGLLGFGKGKRQYLVSNEGLRKGCLPRQLMLYPGFSTMTEGKVDDLVENFKEVLNKENYEELHLPFSENVSHTLAPKAFLASLEAIFATVQKQ